MEKERIYEEKMEVPYIECDVFRRLRLSALLRMAEQIATDQCSALGIDQALYQRTHTAFLLAKQAIEIRRRPGENENLTVRTCPEEARHAVNKRITHFWDESGEEIAVVDARWVLVDTETRRILRRQPPEFTGRWQESEPVELSLKLEKPEQLENLPQQKAVYSLCDWNGHINNTRYADLICDILPPQLLAEREISRFVIYYHREVPLGEPFSLAYGKTENGFYFVGEREGERCFEAQLNLQETGPALE